MKQLTYLLLSICLLFACNANEDNASTNEESTQDANKVLAEFTTLTFEGSLKAKNDIPIAMTLNKNGQTISGEMLYKKVGQPISLTGTIDDANIISLQESVDNEVTGYYEGKIVNSVFNGIWESGDKKRSFDFSLNTSNNDFSTFIKKKAEVLKYTGLYEIKPAEGRDADYHYMFEIEQTSEENIKYLFYGNRGKPSYNMGSIEGEAIIKGNIAYIENDSKTCKFSLTFSDDGVEAVYVDDKNECDFGFGVYLEGSYIKTNSDKPSFENPMR